MCSNLYNCDVYLFQLCRVCAFFYCASDWFASRKLKITVFFISVYNKKYTISIKSWSGLSMHACPPHAFWDLFPTWKKRMWKYLQVHSPIVTPQRLEKKICSVAQPLVCPVSIFLPPLTGSTGHQAKVLNGWIRLIRVDWDHIQADRCNIDRRLWFPLHHEEWRGRCCLFSPEGRKSSSALTWNLPIRYCKKAISACFLPLTAALLQLPDSYW